MIANEFIYIPKFLNCVHLSTILQPVILIPCVTHIISLCNGTFDTCYWIVSLLYDIDSLQMEVEIKERCNLQDEHSELEIIL